MTADCHMPMNREYLYIGCIARLVFFVLVSPFGVESVRLAGNVFQLDDGAVSSHCFKLTG